MAGRKADREIGRKEKKKIRMAGRKEGDRKSGRKEGKKRREYGMSE